MPSSLRNRLRAAIDAALAQNPDSPLAEKKAAYADYRKARDSMKELQTIKANIDRLMGYDKQENQKEAVPEEQR